ncbi:retrovirus-related pol polyprotein from transposon TNT 1-94 [Tanacetum coccineum]
MTRNHSKLKNFVEKFTETVKFRNDHFGAIMGYGDYVIGDSVISRVYYVEGLGHNLFFVGQFCDSDLEVAFRKHSCFVRDINGVDLLKGSRSTNLYMISIDDMMKSSLICLLSKASKSKSWLWHRRLNHLNFGTINDLARKDLARFNADYLKSTDVSMGREKLYFAWLRPESILIHIRPQQNPYELVLDRSCSYNFDWIGHIESTNKRTRRLMETIHVTFDEMHQTMAPVRISSGPEPIMMTPGQLNSGLAPSHVPATTNIPPTDKDLEILFQRYAPSTSHSLSSSQVHPPVFPQGVAAGPTIEDTSITQADLHPSVNPVAGEPSSAQSTSGDVSLAEPNQVTQPPDHLRIWTKDHPLDNIVQSLSS